VRVEPAYDPAMRTVVRLRHPFWSIVVGFVSVFAAIPSTAQADHVEPADELLFYRASDGLFKYYDVGPDGRLGSPILGGDGYTTGWSSISSVDLEGDGQDEMFFYRNDGLFRFYGIEPDGDLGAPILAGDGYTSGWSSITSVDLEGDGRDEMLFYRASDGLFKYYDVGPGGKLGSPLRGGDGYTTGWSSITSVDLDGDGQDEMFFYRDDGLFRFYGIEPDGELGAPILAGDGYTKGWSSITSVDLEGDGRDEMLFYRASDGLFKYYDVGPGGKLGSPILGGDGYTTGWSSITSVNLDEVTCGPNPFTSTRVASLEARYPAQSFTAHVYDTRTGCNFSMNSSERLRTASVFKVMVMAGTLLEAQTDDRPLTAFERSRLIPMITESANQPVRDLWNSFGGAPWFDRQTDLFTLGQTNAIGDNESGWGRTTTSAADQVHLLRQVLVGDSGPLKEEYRQEAWDLMTSVVPSQTWGITAGVPDGWVVSQKNGFAGGVTNSVGFVQDPHTEEGYVVAILTNGWPTWQAGVPTVEEISRWVTSELAH
jgi:hypothetical protein